MAIEIRDEIWILADNRPGTFSQSIALAEALKTDYKVINLKYSIVANLPNHLLSESKYRISKKTRKKLESNYLPKIIISAGRRSAPIALYLKNKSQGNSKIIQIMNPNLNLEKFDLVILPKHDEGDFSNYNNVILTTGALSKINDDIISKEKAKFSEDFKYIKKPIIALLVGGSSKKTKFDKNSMVKLATQASNIANNMSAKLIILNSRRTSAKLNDTMLSNLDCDFDFFDWHKFKDQNPYLAVLGYADFFIITGDSVSMISESCSTGKPTYIFDQKNISSKKHRRFHQDLLKSGFARILTDEIKLENFITNRLEETKRVSSIIKEKL